MAPSPLPLAHARRTRAIWSIAQGIALAGLAAVVVGLWLEPETATRLFWRGIVPLVPVLLLIHPTLWRNVCPLATLSIRGDGGTGPAALPRDRGSAPSPFWRPALLLVLLIALRPLGLDGSGPASATLLMGLGTAAVLGRRRPRKAGFCNRYCPVLAVERLYGQSPLVNVANARCNECSLCMSRGCLDLSPGAASAQLLGPERRTGGWLRSPLGAFAAVFPGIVLAFHTLPPQPSVLRVVLGFVGWAAASGLLSVLTIRVTGVSWRTGFRALAAVSAALYLTFALPGIAQVWGVPASASVLRLAGVALVTIWFVRGGRGACRVV